MGINQHRIGSESGAVATLVAENDAAEQAIGTPASEDALAHMCAAIDQISTLPQVAMRVIEVANNPDAGAADLKVVLEQDAALSARVLKCVNSAAYALRSKVGNLQLAVSYLGFRQVRNLAVTASVSEVFKQEGGFGTYQREMLWDHLVSVALGARLVATRQKLPDFDDAFLAGLLHDIGIILEDQYVHPKFRTMIESLDDVTPLIVAEQEQLGFDHTQLGYRVGRSWKFPDHVLNAIRFHHADFDSEKYDLEIVRCVEISNLVCTLMGHSSIGRKTLPPPRCAIAQFGLTKRDLKVYAEDFEREFKQHDSLYKL